MFLSTRRLTTDPLTQFHIRLSGWVGAVVSSSFVPGRRINGNKRWIKGPMGDGSWRWRHRKPMWKRSGDCAKKPLQPLPPRSRSQKRKRNRSKTTTITTKKIKCSLCFPKNGISSGKVRTQHAFTQGQCCVSAILDPLLQFWTSEWCRGAKNGGVFFSGLSVNTLGVECWCRLLMWVSERREGGGVNMSDAMPGKTIQ